MNGTKLANWLNHRHGLGERVFGIAGPPGCGKSTVAREAAKSMLQAYGLNTAVVSLDDFYLPLAQRKVLATLTPLLEVRGVPGTHEIELVQQTLADFRAREATVTWPRFDKQADDRLSMSHSWSAPGAADIVLLEGWCVGCRPLPTKDLASISCAGNWAPEAIALWCAHVNTSIKKNYVKLWSQLDRWIYLAAPDWPSVVQWRLQQESNHQGPSQWATPRVKELLELLQPWAQAFALQAKDWADGWVALDTQRRPIRYHGMMEPE